jgi:hypothetical protein
VLAALMAARLAAGQTGPHPLPLSLRISRAATARSWLASLALPATLRAPFARVVDASAGESRAAVAAALATVIEVTGPHLDHPAQVDLRSIAHALSDPR